MKYVLILSLIVISVSCAQVEILTGGKTDIHAPVLDSAKTHPLNGALNFNEQEINLRFKEYIKLNNANENIIITPQLKEKPEFTAKNKNFKLTFNEVLDPNTTYVINFNGAIQDITEQNDSVFQYVFSTGSYIDSLSISGHISDSYTNRPISKCLIGIYPATQTVNFDSIPYLIKPTYIGQTNENGDYKVDYLKEGEYHVFAITDKNRDLLFNPGDEKIGFLSQKSVVVNKNVDSVDFKMFNVKPKQTIITKTELNYPGKLELVFNQTPKDFTINSKLEFVQQESGRNDSLIYWLAKTPGSTAEFYININNTETDTIRPILKNTPDPKKKPKGIKISSNDQSGKLLPNQNFTLTISEPIQLVDTSKIHFYNSDSAVVNVTYEIKNVTDLMFNTKDKSIALYEIDSAAITTTFNNVNDRSKKGKLTQLIAEEYYGNLIVTVDSLQGQHIFELLDNQNKVVSTIVKNDNEKTITFNNLEPGEYSIRLVEDSNSDGVWTTGSIKENQQPEHVYYYTDEIKIRSKWDFDVEWIIIE